MSMRFCCPNRECESSRENLQKKVVQKVVPTELGMEYNQAIEHRKTCLFVKHYCKWACGQKVMGCDMDEHKNECTKYTKKCPKCNIDFLALQEESHECLQALIEFRKKLQKNKEEISTYLGTDYENINARCS